MNAHYLKLMGLVMLACLLGHARDAPGDWLAFEPAKYFQLVDTRVQPIPGGPGRPMATAVNVSDQIAADDFPCIRTGPITDVHIWGAWEDSQQDPPMNFAGFRVGFHDDIPAVNDQHSQPGRQLWRADIGLDFITERVIQNATIGHWYDRLSDPHWKPVNLTAVQYNMDLEAWAREVNEDLFVQKGEPGARRIYWLSIEAMFEPGAAPEENEFGWISSAANFNDDAAEIDLQSYTGGFGGADPWMEIRYSLYDPGNGFHPLAFGSLDLAFVIVPEPAVLVLVGAGGLMALGRRR